MALQLLRKTKLTVNLGVSLIVCHRVSSKIESQGLVWLFYLKLERVFEWGVLGFRIKGSRLNVVHDGLRVYLVLLKLVKNLVTVLLLHPALIKVLITLQTVDFSLAGIDRHREKSLGGELRLTLNLCLGLEIDTIKGLITIENTIILWLQILLQVRTIFEINLPLTYLLEL